MYSKEFTKAVAIAFVTLFISLWGGAMTNAVAFSVDVDNLKYTDTSGPREINYDFSTGTYGANTIGLPEAAIIQKNAAADLGFAFGVVPEVGIATLSAPSNSVATFATSAEGAAILQGSSSTTPPPPAASWTFSLALKNFAGVADAEKRYRFEIGAAVPPPSTAGPQPRFGGEWDSSGNLSLQAIVEDDDADAIYFESEVVGLTGLTPTATSVELKIDNNTSQAGKVVFSYSLNGGTNWTVIATYTIPVGVVFNSLPARFPYLYISEGAPESPFGVHSQHWPSQSYTGGTYNAWFTVDDPGQANYSAVSVNSPGYLPETSMIFNSAGGYWEIPAQVFADNFDNNTIDTANWTTSGNSVAESEGVLKVAQGTEDAGGKVLSRAFQINPYAPIVVQRKAKVHYANEYFDGSFALFFDDNPDFSTLNETQMSVFASHAHYNYTTTGEQPADGFYLGRYAAHFTNPTARTSSTPWDVWFDEKIVYDPVSGVAELYINGVPEATINVGALPSGATYMKLYIDSWGWYTGHSNDSADLSVSQKYTGTPVDLSNDVPPAAGSVVFNFTATKKAGGTEVISQPITGYVEQFATITAPSGSVSTNPVFTWTGIGNATSYAVEVNDTNWNRVWSLWDIPPGTTSVAYNIDGKAPPLENGKTYNFNIISTIETGGQENSSFAQGSFTYNGTASSTISFSGLAATVPNWPSTDGAAPVSGATVMAMPVPDGMTYGSAQTQTNGAFALPGIPAAPAVFRLVLQHPAGDSAYPFVLSKLMSWNESIQALLPFVFLTADQYAGFGNAANTGMILGRVALKSSPTTSFLSGATITAREWNPATQSAGVTTYGVSYNGGGSATGSDGVYFVKSVPDGTFVQLVATLAGHTFDFDATSVVLVQSGRISEDSFFATPAAVTTPVITSLSATSGAYGSTLTIYGSNFGTTEGTVTIGGAPVTVTSWTATAITATLGFPAHSGAVVVKVGEAESNTDKVFQVTSPSFYVELVDSDVKVIKGQAAEFLLKTSFFNNFTTEGITLNLQNGDSATLAGIASFTPVPIKSGGGVVLKINTAGLDAGTTGATYTADIMAASGAQSMKAGTLNLKVVTVKNIIFYEMIYDSVNNVSTRVDLTSMNVASQGQLNIFTEVIGSDDAIITDDFSGAGPGVVLTEAGASILGIYSRFWGYDIYAAANGSTTLRASTPDGFSADLPITVNFPTDSYIDGIGFTAPDGTAPFSAPNKVYNNRADPITWYASGTTTLGWIGSETAGMMNFGTDFFEKLNRASDGLSATSIFNMQNLPTDIGTAIFYASTNDGKARAVVPLTTVNAPGTGLLAFYIRSLDSNAFAEMFTLYFYGAVDGLLKFTKDVYAMHLGNKPALVGNIPPGSYKILFAPGNTSVKPQWWPNAYDISGAVPLNFAADGKVGDIYFFAGSQAANEEVALPTPATRNFAPQAGTGSIAFTAGDSYVWSAGSNVDWITITPATGISDGTVNYTVAANPFSYTRTGIITIGGQQYTITQAGTGLVPVHAGTWGVQQLIHFDDGHNLVGDVAIPWYAEVTRATFNEDGTGTMVMTKNDHNGELKQQTQSFAYTTAGNADGSMDMAITMAVDGVSETDTVRLVVSDDGSMAVVDGTANDYQQKLMVLYRIDATKTYSVGDVSGEYYNVGFERNDSYLADPPDSGNGRFMAIASIHTFDGYGHYNYYGMANSVKIDGSNLIWTDTGKTYQSYSVAADGRISVAEGAFQGWVTGNGLVGGGGGVFKDTVNNQNANFFLKKGDRAYATADLAGRWAIVSLGQDSNASDPASQGFYSSIGTMICDNAGNCSIKVKDRNSSGTATTVTTDSLTFTVAADGSFGTSFGGQSPTYAGAIGNNGNTLLINPSLRYPVEISDPWNREIMIAIRAKNIGDLAGGTAVLKGDINDDGNVDLADAVLALKVMVGLNPPAIRPLYQYSGADVNGDGKVGQHELLHILQRLSGLRQ
ncbi:MAG: IPT/TIG domain-containing protein [Syntrophales bacterium]